MACLLHARGTSRIASFLSIAPRTVGTHIRNIMLKLECNSRESIIDFVEKSDKLPLLRIHYTSLLIFAAFEKSLREISRQKRMKESACLILYSDVQSLPDFFLERLQWHLGLAGLEASLKAYESQEELKRIYEGKAQNYIIYLIADDPPEPPDNDHLNILEPFLKSKQISSTIFILFSSNSPQKKYGEFKDVNTVSFSEEESYYFSFFELLGKLHPSLNLERFITAFKEQYTTMQCPDMVKQYIGSRNERELEKKENNICQYIVYMLRNKKWISVSAIFIIGFLAIRTLNMDFSLSCKGTLPPYPPPSVRSDLIIPTSTALLKRPDVIAQIENSLHGQKGIHTVALVGMAGAGKTTLARLYAQQHKLPVVWEVNAETEESLKFSFERLASKLAQTFQEEEIFSTLKNISNPIEREGKIIAFVKEHLRSYPGWLLIYDNVEKFLDIQKHFPYDPDTWGHGKVILTTVDGNIQANKHVDLVIQIGALNSAQKFALFRKIMNSGTKKRIQTPNENREAELFLEKIPPFPLDISIAAYYLKAIDISYAAYLDHLYQSTKEFEGVQEDLLEASGDYLKTRYSIIALTLEQIMAHHKDFKELLLFISLIDSQNIPRELLDNNKSNVVVDDFIYQINKYSLASNEVASKSLGSLFSLHRSIQKITLDYFRQRKNLKEDKTLGHSIVDSFEKYISTIIEKEDYSKMKRMVNHCEIFLKNIEVIKNVNKTSIVGELGKIYYYLGDYKKATHFLEESFPKLNNHDVKNYNKIAEMLIFLADVYRELGNYEKAKIFLEQSLTIYEKHVPENYIKRAQALVNLGNVYREQGKYIKAKDLFEQSYEIYKKYLPHDHKGISKAFVYLGIIYREIGDYDAARDYFHKSLEICIAYSPKNCLEGVWASAHLGVLYRETGHYEKAKDLLEKSLKVYLEHLSENHTRVAWIFAHLGATYRETAHYEKARDLLEKSLSINKMHFRNNDHFRVAWGQANLGSTHGQRGNYEKARNFLEKSLKFYEKNYGQEHVERARILRDLGKLYFLEESIEFAEGLIKEALMIFQLQNHPESYTCLESLSDLYIKKSIQAFQKRETCQSTGFQGQAINYIKKALEVVTTRFPSDSPHLKRLRLKVKDLVRAK